MLPYSGRMPPTPTVVVRRSVTAVAQSMPPVPTEEPAGTSTLASGSDASGTWGSARVPSVGPLRTSRTASVRPELSNWAS
ncbi:hypothetical protein SFUMM280S_06566 [Streptomyces fumanus]